MELDSTLERVSWVVNSSKVIVPSLVNTVMASVEDNVSSIGVAVAMDIETVVGHKSDSLVSSSEPSDLLSWLISVWSSMSISWLPGLGAVLIGDHISSVSSKSDGLGSPVKDEPLLGVPWGIVSDSELVSVDSTSVLSQVEGSVSRHSCLDLESSAISEWVSWPLDVSSVDVPSLSSVVLGPPPNNLSVLV